jgi:hypothetical protein
MSTAIRAPGGRQGYDLDDDIGEASCSGCVGVESWRCDAELDHEHTLTRMQIVGAEELQREHRQSRLAVGDSGHRSILDGTWLDWTSASNIWPFSSSIPLCAVDPCEQQKTIDTTGEADGPKSVVAKTFYWKGDEFPLEVGTYLHEQDPLGVHVDDEVVPRSGARTREDRHKDRHKEAHAVVPRLPGPPSSSHPSGIRGRMNTAEAPASGLFGMRVLSPAGQEARQEQIRLCGGLEAADSTLDQRSSPAQVNHGQVVDGTRKISGGIEHTRV